jgi:hypothetical protein
LTFEKKIILETFIMMKDDKVVEVESTRGNVVDETTGNASSSAQTSGVSVGVGKFNMHVSDRQLPLVGVFSAAMVLLIAVCVSAKGAKNYAYGISVAVVAMFFSLLGFMLLTLADNLNNAKFANWNYYFLSIWCSVGAFILTFSGPFTVTSNGYFASWGLVIFSLMGVGLSGNSMKQSVVGLGPLLGLGVSAIIVIFASANEIDGFYSNESIYALVVACLTVIVVAIFFAPPEKVIPGTKFYFLLLFSILWIVLAFLVTFRGPFLVTGNGYFGSWGGAVTSVFATMSALKDE